MLITQSSILKKSFFFVLGVLAPVESQSTNVCTFEGGWALRVVGNTCPMNAPVNCGKGLQLRCCANGLKCAGEGDYAGNYCCKEGEDCRARSVSNPRCPDQSWTLWGGNGTLDKGGWCCEPGSNGYYQGNMDAVGCTSAGVSTLSKGLSFASTVQTVGCVPSTTSSPSATAKTTAATPTATRIVESNTSSSPQSTSPSSSSLSGAAIAGIVVGAIGGVVLIAAVCVFLKNRKKQKNNHFGAAQKGDHFDTGSQSHMAQPGTFYGETAKAPGALRYGHQQGAPQELYGDAVHEMDNGQQTLEASHGTPKHARKPHELP